MAGDNICVCGRSECSDEDMDRHRVHACRDSTSTNTTFSGRNDDTKCGVSPILFNFSHPLTSSNMKILSLMDSSLSESSQASDNSDNLKSKRQMNNIPVKTGSAVFVEELQTRNFASSEEILLHLEPQSLTVEFFQENGFDVPIMITSTVGLGIKMPPANISFSDIEALVGSNVDIEVINVAQQTDEKMKLSEFVKYMLKPKRTRVLNVLSLECSDTKLGELVYPPRIAEKIDWVNMYWPKEENDPLKGLKPKVQKYCLMAPKGAYTDFHVDFGGSSVWYHVLRGEKIFYLIEPTDSNLALYDSWMESKTRLQTFFADQVSRCYKLVVKEGTTILLPSGWIHAVLTPEDTLVFGGNFLHSYNIELQLKIYEIEIRQQMEEKFLFPQFKTLNWLAADHLIKQLTSINRTRSIAPLYLIKGLKALWFTLKQWKISPLFSEKLPDEGGFPLTEHLTNELLKSISREVKRAQKILITVEPPKPIRESTRVKKKPYYKDFVEYDTTFKDDTSNEACETICTGNYEGNINNYTVKNRQKKHLKLTIPSPATYPYKNKSKLKTNFIDMPVYPDIVTRNPVIQMRNSVSNNLRTDGNESSFPVYSPQNVSHNHENTPNFYLIKKSGKVTNKMSRNRYDTSLSATIEKSPYCSDGYHASSDSYQFIDEETSSESQKNWKIRIGDSKIIISKDKEVLADSIPAIPMDFGHDSYMCDHSNLSELSNDEDNLTIDERSLSSSVNEVKKPEEFTRGSLNGSPFSFNFESAKSYDAHECLLRFKVAKHPLKNSPTNIKYSNSVFPNASTSSEKSKIGSHKTNATGNGEVIPVEIDLHEVHQDDEYIYPSFFNSSDEEDMSSQRKKDMDIAWSPRVKINCTTEKAKRPMRQGTMKKAVEKGLEAAKKRHNVNAGITDTLTPKKKVKAKSDDSIDGLLKSTHKNKKPKKGFATPKQRLGKILKLHKLIN